MPSNAGAAEAVGVPLEASNMAGPRTKGADTKCKYLLHQLHGPSVPTLTALPREKKEEEEEEIKYRKYAEYERSRKK